MTLQSIDEYGPSFQMKVISSLLTHKDFLINIYDILDPEMFGKDAHKWIIKEISSYYQKYHTSPSMDVLKTEIKKISNKCEMLVSLQYIILSTNKKLINKF